MRRRPPVVFAIPLRRRRVAPERESHPAAEKFYDSLTDKFKQEGIGYIQGQDVCPICKGVINFTYHKMQGFLVYECSSNDCLPWPDGGAQKRRREGLVKITPTRFK